jgi:tetratricopeptide (TPR) repeat protein
MADLQGEQQYTELALGWDPVQHSAHKTFQENLEPVVDSHQPPAANQGENHTRPETVPRKADTPGMGETHDPRLAQSVVNLRSLAQSCREQAQHQEALILFEQVLALQEQILGKSHPELATDLLELARLKRILGDLKGCGESLNRALHILEERKQDRTPEYALALYEMAGVLRALHHFRESEAIYQRALEIFETYLDSSRTSQFGRMLTRYVSAVLNGLGLLYVDLESWAEAELVLKRSLTLQKKSLPTGHPEIAATLNNLARLKYALGKYSEAEDYYSQAWKIREKVYGAEHPQVAHALTGLGAVYYATERLELAESFFRKALVILGANHQTAHQTDLAFLLDNLGGVRFALGDLTEAETLISKALDILEKVYGPNHPQVAQSLNHLARIYLAQGHSPEAHSLISLSLEILEGTYGTNHAILFPPLVSLARLHRDRSEYQTAEKAYQHAVAIGLQTWGAAHPEVRALQEELRQNGLTKAVYASAQPAVSALPG